MTSESYICGGLQVALGLAFLFLSTSVVEFESASYRNIMSGTTLLVCVLLFNQLRHLVTYNMPGHELRACLCNSYEFVPSSYTSQTTVFYRMIVKGIQLHAGWPGGFYPECPECCLCACNTSLRFFHGHNAHGSANKLYTGPKMQP